MTKKLFEGIKILEFAWVAVGPMMANYFANHGATVVRIENPARPDPLRAMSPFPKDKQTLDTSMFFGRYNPNKYDVTLDLTKPKGMELAWRFIKWADIMTEAFRPGTMKKYGLDYESVRKVRPDIIYFSTSMMGQWGPYSLYAGYGTQLAVLSGMGEITGWPNSMPAPPYGAYIDFINQRFNSSCVIAALEYRRRTGKGQYVEQSQMETGIQFLSPLFLDYTVNNRIATRNGNRHPLAVPHAVFPCRGDEKWVAIAVFSGEEWEAFCKIINEPSLTKDPKFATFLGRKENEDELEKLIGDWTSRHSVQEVEAMLQAAGVSAQMVEKISDLYEDPQLKHRGYWTKLNHPEIGPVSYEPQACYILSKTPREIVRPSPCLGEHNEYVYKELLGLTDDELSDYIAEGAIPFPGDLEVRATV